LLLVDDVQPAIDNEATITIIKIIVIISRFIFDSPHFTLRWRWCHRLLKRINIRLFALNVAVTGSCNSACVP
jgi:hypothetical protein